MSELPAGWLALKLGDVVDYASNTTVHPKAMQPDAWLLELEDIERDSSRLLSHATVEDRKPQSAKNAFQAGDVLYGKLRPYLNKVIRANRNGYCSSEIIPIKPNQLDGSYLFHYLKSPHFLAYVRTVTHGVRMPRLGTHQARSAPFPLPPFEEQKRIAQKLDALLAQVDTLKARIDAIPALVAQVRRSTLALVTVGTSSASATESATAVDPTDYNHRAQITLGDEVLELPPGWTSAPLGSLIDSSRKLCYGVVQPGPEVESGIEMIRVCDINGGKIAWGELRRISQEVDNEYRRSRVAPGDILLSVVGSIGRAAIVRESRPANIARAVARVAADRSRVSSEWLCLWLTSPRVQWWLLSSSKEVARKTLNLKELSELPVPVPPKEVQDATVRRVEQLFAFADQLEARVSATQKRIDTLTQSLLAKAFRGELVPQDPNDEPASVLLERIRAQRAAAPKPKRGRKATVN